MSSAVAPMTREEIVHGLVLLGSSRAAANRAADLEMARRGYVGASNGTAAIPLPPDPATPAITWPLQLTLPWSYLVSDNDKYGAALVQIAGGKLIAKLILQQRYREAKSKIRTLARNHVAGAEPVKVALRLEARVWVPDTSRKHDVANFAKCVHDALQEAVYTDDTWLHDVRWIRAGVDVDRPRAELTISPILP